MPYLEKMTETVSQQLQQARQARSLSLEHAANATHIRLHYLKALEEGNFDALPSLTQARGFLRAYAGYLGLDAGRLLEEIGDEFPSFSGPTLPGRTREKPEISSVQADAIFTEVGQKLHQHRDLLGLSLEDVERHTHLRIHYLQALEAGNLKGLPSPVQGRGMLNNYANFLGLDPEPLLLRFAEGLQARLVAQQATRPREKPARITRPRARVSPFQRLFSLEFLVAGSIILFLSGFILWGALRVSAMRSQASRGTPTSTAPSIADILLSTGTTIASPSPLAAQASGTVALPGSAGNGTTPVTQQETISAVETITTTLSTVMPPASGSAPIEIYLVVRQRTWVRVLVDGKTEFEGRMMPGRAYTFQGKERVELLTGNGAALHVFFNQADLGVLGGMGEVAYRVFTIQGMMTPTATLTFTPQPTSQDTPTPATTPSPGPTATATR